MLGLFKKYKKYHVSFACSKNGNSVVSFADQLVVTKRKIDPNFLQELRNNARDEYGFDKVAILNIIKL